MEGALRARKCRRVTATSELPPPTPTHHTTHTRGERAWGARPIARDGARGAGVGARHHTERAWLESQEREAAKGKSIYALSRKVCGFRNSARRSWGREAATLEPVPGAPLSPAAARGCNLPAPPPTLDAGSMLASPNLLLSPRSLPNAPPATSFVLLHAPPASSHFGLSSWTGGVHNKKR